MRATDNLNGIRAIIARHKFFNSVFRVVGAFALMIGVFTFIGLFSYMLIDGAPRLSWDFLPHFHHVVQVLQAYYQPGLEQF